MRLRGRALLDLSGPFKENDSLHAKELNYMSTSRNFQNSPGSDGSIANKYDYRY